LITDYHTKLYAHELRRRHSAGDSEKLAGALFDAQVDLNPHQVEAALFAFRSPLSKGAILADEVGLGKTIEAGLVLAQKWTEGKRRILVICPANLRKQWSQAMADKFFLPSQILESAEYNRQRKNGVRNPFEQPALVICSFQFAARQSSELMVTRWDSRPRGQTSDAWMRREDETQIRPLAHTQARHRRCCNLQPRRPAAPADLQGSRPRNRH